MTVRHNWHLGFPWGAILAAMPLVDFSLRPQRGGLASYSYDIVREAPPHAAALAAFLLLMNAVPVLAAVMLNGVDFRRSGFLPLLALANLAAVTGSLAGSSAMRDLAYVVLIAFVFSLCILGTSLRDAGDEFVRGLLCGFSLCVAVVFLVVIADGNFSYGRLMGRSGPNYWGMNAMAGVMTSLAWRRVPVRLALMSVGLVMIVLCQSRGAMLSTTAGLTVVAGIILWNASPRRRWTLLFLGVAGLVLVAFFAHGVISDRLLLLGDKGRGLDSGGTGRFAAWVEAFRLFAAEPWLGVGYRKHEEMISAASSAHNAYLATLADTGLLGFLAYMTLMLGGWLLAVRRGLGGAGGASLAISGLLTGYLVQGLVERMALNTGNALSLLVLYAVAFSYRRPAARAPSLLMPRNPAAGWA